MSTTLADTGLSTQVPGKIKRLKVLIFGPPGSWKTVNAHQMPRTRTIDFDDGLQSVEWAILDGVLDKRLEEIVHETIIPEAEEKKKVSAIHRATDQIDEWIAEEDIPDEEWDRPYEKEWDTLIVDSCTALTEASIMLGVSENKRLGTSRTMGEIRKSGVIPMKIQDWGSAKQVFMKFIRQCQNLGKNLIVIAHDYHVTNDEGRVQKITPNVIGTLRSDLPAEFDEVWYARLKGSRKKRRAVFQTVSDAKREAKSRVGCLDDMEDPADFMAIKKKIAKFYKVPEEMLWTAAHGIEEVEEELQKEAEDAVI